MDEKMWLVCQMVPPLKVWGDSVSSDHISVILLVQTPKALVRFSTIQLLSKSPSPQIVMTLYWHFWFLAYTEIEVNAMSTINVTSAPKTATFQMRINPEVKQRMEEIYARQGLSFTDAVNIFIQQSLNMEGLDRKSVV